MNEPLRLRLRRCAAPRGALRRLREQPARGPAKRGSTAIASRHARPTHVPTICIAGPKRPRLCAVVALICALLVVSTPTFAEKADKEKPINFSAEQPAEVDFEKRVGTLKGNVVITQGTLSIKADRIDFKQNPDNSISATAYGNPITFRQKKDDSDEYYEGFAQRAVYDGQKDLLELFDRALLRQGSDEIRSNYISYNSSSGVFRAEGRPNAPDAPEGPGERVRGVFQPKSDSPLGKDLPKAGKAEPAAKNSKDKAGDAKDKSAAKSQSKDKAPVTLKPTDELKQ